MHWRNCSSSEKSVQSVRMVCASIRFNSSTLPESSSAALFALLLDERLGFLTGADILMDGGVVASGASGLSK